MNPTNLIAPLTRFLEANQAIRRDQLVARRRKGLQTAVAQAFEKQGRLFLRSLGQLKGEFDANAARMQETAVVRNGEQTAVLREAVSAADWLLFWDAAARDSKLDLTDPLQAAILDMLILGGGDLIAGLGIAAAEQEELGISWNLANPRAVEYARQHAAAQVTKINDTTRSYLNSMISQAAAEGHSYNRLSDAIAARFTEFATGGDNPRSKRVAVFELGDAYEEGNRVAAKELQAAGLDMEKKALTAGDDRVRPSHRSNQTAGWIGIDDPFPSGDMRFPSDPGCRCATLYRRKQLTSEEKRQRELQREREEIDRLFRQELEQIQSDPVAHILPPPGRAPRGAGGEYSDRRAIAGRIRTQIKFRGQLQHKLDRYRGQKNRRYEMDIATARVQELTKAIDTALQVADGPGDWAFKRELVNGVFEYLSATTRR